MMTPSISSTGQEAHQPTTADLRPAAVIMFHRAGTRRSEEETGCSPFSVGTKNSLMPWTSGGTPVATVVQITGEA
jgi:hypothetical protein